MRGWQQVRSGERFSSGPISVSEEDVAHFARQFDPQPYHLDRAAAEASIFGGLCASGWQIAALATRLLDEAFKNAEIAQVGLTAVDQLRWKRPLFAGEQLTVHCVVLEQRAGSPVPDCGTVTVTMTVYNQDQQPVLESHCSVAVDCQGAPA